MARRKTMDEKIPAFTPGNLQCGIDIFRKKWPKDLHADFYRTLACAHKSKPPLNGGAIMCRLHEWAALRRSAPGMCERWESEFSNLEREYCKILCLKNPSIESCEWEQVEPLFDIAHKIKGVPSAVFASKLCHFILPSVFTVVDVKVMRLNLNKETYGRYWNFCQKRWRECDQEELKRILHQALGKGVHTTGYPWATKIAELCVMGRKGQTECSLVPQ